MLNRGTIGECYQYDVAQCFFFSHLCRLHRLLPLIIKKNYALCTALEEETWQKCTAFCLLCCIGWLIESRLHVWVLIDRRCIRHGA